MKTELTIANAAKGREALVVRTTTAVKR